MFIAISFQCFVCLRFTYLCGVSTKIMKADGYCKSRKSCFCLLLGFQSAHFTTCFPIWRRSFLTLHPRNNEFVLKDLSGELSGILRVLPEAAHFYQ